MTKLTETEMIFLEKHKISLGAVFDAKGLGPKKYGASMRALGKAVAFGVTPCKKEGHTLRSRSGSCVVCSPSNLGFQSRFDSLAYVYIAGSLKLKLIKAGYAFEIEERLSSLNEQGYAGASDWEVLFWVKAESAGRIEFSLHSELSKYRKPTSFVRSGNTIDCLETFSCAASSAMDALKSLIKNENQSWTNEQKISQFEFGELNNNGIKRKRNYKGNAGAVPLVRSKQTSLTPDTPYSPISVTPSFEQMRANQSKAKDIDSTDPKVSNNNRRSSGTKNLIVAVFGLAMLALVIVLFL